MQQQSYPYLCWVDPLNINNKGRRLTRLRIGVTHIPLPNITIVTQKDRKLEIGHGNKSEYTVQMYLEVLCKLCFDNTITKSNEDRVLVLLRALCQTLQTKHLHKCLISDVKEAGKRWPYSLSSKKLLGTKSFSISICLKNKNTTCTEQKILIHKKGSRVNTLADIYRLSVQYNVEKLSNL
jgi:hypothetical protein